MQILFVVPKKSRNEKIALQISFLIYRLIIIRDHN